MIITFSFFLWPSLTHFLRGGEKGACFSEERKREREMSSAAGRFGGGSSDEPFFLHHRGAAYHVPQYSRREKLRYPQEGSPPPPSFLNPPLYQPNGAFLPNLLPSSSCSSSYLYPPNPNYSMANIVGGSSLHQGQIQQPQSFSLTLSPPPPQAPLGPFTGYSAVLNRSRFLEPARKLLEEMCNLDRAESVSAAGDPPAMLSVDHEMEGRASGLVEEQQWKKARLISMIDEVCKRYTIYYQQVQTVIRSFEMVVGLSTTAPYVLLALKSMFKNFRCLKNAIYNQINHINGASGKEGFSITEISGLDFISGEPGVACAQQGGNSSGAFSQSHVWRHQRGLPERAVSVLRAWLFEHFLHPYPTDVDKQMLAKQTHLTRSQVSNWFINARVRLWKPMVEEIHNLEMQAQMQKAAVADESETPQTQASKPSSSSNNQPSQNSCIQRNQNTCPRLLYNELSYIANHIEEPYSYAYNDISVRDHAVEGTAGVSLTLGLHQNTGIRLPEPLVLNAARHFSLEDFNGTYGVGAFEGQEHRHFGKDIGGHLLQDFVG